MLLTEWLDDLCVRFIINLPIEELSSAARICFQIEEAQWFYEDFVRPLDPDLPSLNLRQFSAVIFQHCPLLKGFSTEDQERAFQAFLEYKTMVPVRGAIMLNDDMDQVVLVKGWKKSANWSFPRGKIDQNELDLTCAVREVYEETGYDLKAAGLVGPEADMKSINVQIRGQDLMMYVFRGVPMDTEFMPRTRKEISKVQWHKLAELPTVRSKRQQQEGQADGLAGNANKFYMVAPFLGALKKWINQQRRQTKSHSANYAKVAIPVNAEPENIVSDNEQLPGSQTHVQDNHLNRLLHTLRQSSQALNSDLPEVSEQQHFPQIGPPPQNDQSTELKALLFSGGAQKDTKSYTQLNQYATESSALHTTGHVNPHAAQQLGIPASSQPLQALLGIRQRPLEMAGRSTNEPQRMLIPPPTEPARVISRQTAPHAYTSIKDKIFPPLQVVEDSMLPKVDLPVHQQPFAPPPASKLPAPKLDTQKSALLSLFSAKRPSTTADGPAIPNTPTAPELASANVPKFRGVPEHNQAFIGSKTVGDDVSSTAATSGTSRDPISNQRNGQVVTSPSGMFVPSQVSRRSSENATAPARQPTAHQSKLLNMFKTTGTNAKTQDIAPLDVASHQSKLLDMFKKPESKPKTQELAPPDAAIELSASPRGDRSRHPSGTVPANVAARPPSKGATLGQIKIQKRPPLDEEPVSATVTGPLNSPQFDMMRNSSQEKRELKAAEKPKKASPVRILARPVAPQKAQGKQPQAETIVRNLPRSSLSSVQQPSTPDIKARDVPPKPFQPTILRRPGTAQDISVPSPIDPLPSPQHKVVQTKETPTKPTDHKKSLLSLFTKPSNPSPVVSPPSAAPLPQGHIESAVISPLENPLSSPVINASSFRSNGFNPSSIAAALDGPAQAGPTPQVAAPEPDKPRKQFYAPDRMPSQYTATTHTVKPNAGSHESANTEKPVPSASPTSTMTAANQQYLLGFLNGLK